MRIISGTHKGRRLQAPKNLPVRPTTDRAKEGLFNILAHRVYWPDTEVLDLFSGTGNIALECASRGCASVTAVDAHPGCVSFIRKTAKALELPVHPMRQDALKYVDRVGRSFDLIFADPPYDLDPVAMKQLAARCTSPELLAEDGIFILEHGRQTDPSDWPGFTEQRVYGSSAFSFFERVAQP
ncbi:RsmD family RNA methyltransferase [Robiginitalea sp. M366]|uniref:RsmD family RNA methyltransferase n=1 Tax=Robiginitalea aestuariiviva TaxID=3036903 RepID=UPI00240D0148|nr:RsmD family RNA methyltransferase [Robiginitalea aestuariiviva]MDG1572619.1 RsmD family RNA methyltransferase [Robiginitalea aestuariiviva]